MGGMEKDFDNRPIGIFDSGVGGLTVLQALVDRFPNEQFLYLGDTARVPYGTKSARTVERYTIQVANFLLRRGVKALIVACNTASALGLAALRAHCRTPVLGVIQPGCRAALSLHDPIGRTPGHIGIIGTRSTIDSGMYPHTLALLSPRTRVDSLACPLFVPLVEEGWVHHPAARLIVEDSLKPLLAKPVDALVLGCTHYPVLKPVIAEVLGPAVRLVDSAAAVATELAMLLGSIVPTAQNRSEPQTEFLVTDVAERFQEVAARFLDNLKVEQVEMIDL